MDVSPINTPWQFVEAELNKLKILIWIMIDKNDGIVE